ncbi:MAG: enoyl-CoA hydratase-related protein [Chloroflexota bacterium]
MAYEMILVETKGNVGVVTLNRPKALNALNGHLMSELVTAVTEFDRDDDIGAIVITGNERAFAAGGDIKQMASQSLADMVKNPITNYWDSIKKVGKPIIAAVSGWCLGGGNELAMLCDMIVASETAMFGQPEINLGVIPGAGGTQRLTKAVGKSIAMEVILNDRRLTADEALHYGLVNRVVPVERYLESAIHLAQEVAERAPLAVRMAKDAINHAYETTLTEGITVERRLFQLLFGTEDQSEGMSAFIEKRKADWTGQ